MNIEPAWCSTTRATKANGGSLESSPLSPIDPERSATGVRFATSKKCSSGELLGFPGTFLEGFLGGM
jgi:hypothetical protein